MIYVMFWPIMFIDIVGALLGFTGCLLSAIGNQLERASNTALDKGYELYRRSL